MHSQYLDYKGFVISASLLYIFGGCSLASADTDVIDTIELTVPIACTMGGVGTNSHNATISPGTYSGASGNEYEAGIGKTTLTSYCNDNNGFSIYAIGFTNDLYEGEDHTKLIGQNTNQTISTKVYANGDTASNWSMKLTKVDNPVSGDPITYNPENMTLTNSFNTWHEVPDTYTKVAEYHSSTTDPSTTDTTLGAKLETTYATFIASDQVADTYTGQVKYTMVHPYDDQPLQPQTTEAGCIRYYPNGGNVEGTMGCQPITASATSATLLASNYSRTGYGFAGWSNGYDYATNPNQEGIEFYGPNEDITFTAGQYTGTNPGLSLYAIWIKSEGSIQDSTKVSQLCSSLTQSGPNVTKTLDSVSALTDQRDNETYAIAKLADGNCWMIENLRLDNQYTTGATNIALAQGYNPSFTGLADPEGPALFYKDVTTANSLYSTNGSTENTISGGNLASRFPRYSDVNTPVDVVNRPSYPTTNSATNSTSDASMYSYGNYYTWAAIVADTTTNTPNNTSITATSICPSGWHAPRSGNKSNESNNEYWLLIATGINNGTNPANYNSNTAPNYTGTPEGTNASNKLRAYPNNFVYAGRVYENSVGYRGSYGRYWSSTAISNTDAYGLGFESNNVSPSKNNGSKTGGWTIRCLTSG